MSHGATFVQIRLSFEKTANKLLRPRNRAGEFFFSEMIDFMEAIIVHKLIATDCFFFFFLLGRPAFRPPSLTESKKQANREMDLNHVHDVLGFTSNGE